MKQRLLALALVLTVLALGGSALTAGCSGNVVPDGGVMLVFTSDGTLPQTASLHFDISVPDAAAPFWSVDERIPADIQLPQTFAVDSNGNAAAVAVVNANVRDENGTVLDDRTDQILEVPTERLAELRIVFSARCSVFAVTLPDGGAASSCGAGTTCDPDSSTCVSDQVPSSTLPTFTGDAGPGVPATGSGDATLSPDAAGDASGGSGDAASGEAGVADASGSEGGGVDLGNNFALLRKGGAASGEYYNAYLDYLAVDGGLVKEIDVTGALSSSGIPFSVERDTHKSLAVDAAGTVYLAGLSLPPGASTSVGLGIIAAVTRAGVVSSAGFGMQNLAPATGAAPLDATTFAWASSNGLETCSGSTCTYVVDGMGVGQLSLLEDALYIDDSASGGHVQQLFTDGGLAAPLFPDTTFANFALLDVMDAGAPDLAYLAGPANILKGSVAGGVFTQEAVIPPMASQSIGQVSFLAAAQTDAVTVTILGTTTNGVTATLCIDPSAGGPTCSTVKSATGMDLLEGVVFVPGP